MKTGASRAGSVGLLSLLLAAGAGCASLGILPRTTEFDRHFEAGRYRAAVEAFEADSALQRREDPLFRVALLYADPREPFHDLDRARELLGRLLELHPDTEHAPEARSLVALLDRLERADARSARLEEKLQRLKKVHLGQPPDTSGARRP